MLEDTLNRLESLVDSELDKIVVKGNLTPTELELATKAVCLLEKIKMVDELESSESSYSMSRNGRSTRRGRSSNGRYMSYHDDYMMDRGYSGHSVRDRMISHLESTMMDEAQSESEKRAIETLIDRLSVEK